MAALSATTLAAFFALVWWERRHHDPVIPIHFLQVPAIARADAVVLCFGACLFALIVYLPLYLQLGRGLGIGASGVLLLPITLAQVTSAAITGRLVTRTGHVTIFPKIGLSVVCLVFVALSMSVDRASTAVILGLTGLAGIGLGMVMPPTQVAVQTAAGRGALGVATGSISLCRAVGGATGVAVAGAVLFAVIDRAGGAATALLHQAMEGGSAFIATLSEVQRASLAGHVNGAYRIAFAVLAGFAAVGALIAATVPPFQWHEGEIDSAEP
jgi:predicted MFS family arabinose efflux permease